MNNAAIICRFDDLLLRHIQLNIIDQPTSDPFSSMYIDPGNNDIDIELNNSTTDDSIAIRKYVRICLSEKDSCTCSLLCK